MNKHMYKCVMEIDERKRAESSQLAGHIVMP